MDTKEKGWIPFNIKFSRIFELPYYLWQFILTDIIGYKSNAQMNFEINRHLNAKVRISKIVQSQNEIYCELQLINTRSVFRTGVIPFINDEELFQACDPSQLIELGHYYSQFLKLHPNPSGSFTKKEPVDASSKKVYPIKFIENKITHDGLMLNFYIDRSNSSFWISVNDLMKDMFLISNISPENLLQIGYISGEYPMPLVCSYVEVQDER